MIRHANAPLLNAFWEHARLSHLMLRKILFLGFWLKIKGLEGFASTLRLSTPDGTMLAYSTGENVRSQWDEL